MTQIALFQQSLKRGLVVVDGKWPTIYGGFIVGTTGVPTYSCTMANNPGKGSVPYVRVAAELVSADHMVGDKLPPYARRYGPLLS
ncbi:MAG: hypothetical protein AB1744_02185, partial [Candidatus Zixiibacteriota bacterium]